MAGLFGWYGNTMSADPEDTHRLLAKMCRDVAFSTETHRDAAVAVTSSVGGGSILRTEDLLVAIAAPERPNRSYIRW